MSFFFSRKGALVFVGAVLASLVSCATLDPYERMTSDDCLVLIPSTLTNDSGTSAGRTFTMEFDNGVRAAIKNETLGYLVVHLRFPIGLVAVNSSVTGERMTGATSRTQYGFTIPYLPGQIVVSSLMFSQTVKKVGEREYMTNWDFVPVPEDVREQVLEAFWKSKEATTWQGAPVAAAEVTPPTASQ